MTVPSASRTAKNTADMRKTIDCDIKAPQYSKHYVNRLTTIRDEMYIAEDVDLRTFMILGSHSGGY